MPRHYPLLPLLMAISLLIGCGSGNGFSTHSGPIASTSPVASTLAATSSVAFGNSPVGSTKTGSLVLRNETPHGEGITISHITISGTPFALSCLPTLPATLGPGQDLSLNVTFSPLAAGTVSGNITVSSNAADPLLSVQVSGVGELVAGQLSVSPLALNFGSVSVGNSSAQTASLVAGATDITVSSADWSGQGFAVGGITFPVTVPAGQSLAFTVTFTPEAAGNAAGNISFLSNATNSPAIESFSGNGTQSTSPHTVSLSWDASTSEVIGYNVYRGTQSGGPYVKLTLSPLPTTTYLDSSVADGMTYFYVSTSINKEGEESTYSNQATATVPIT